MATHSKTCRACGKTFTGGEVFCPDDGSRLLGHTRSSQTLDPLIGTQLDGRYRILRVLGEGGMGIVYEAEHTLIERRVAIKVLREDFCERADVVERFKREAKSASRIGHPNIVDVLDFGETPGGASYFVMEMLSGEDLADVLARNGALAPERAALIVYQCCHALSAAHEKGIVHRDLKPENIFLIERDGASDFVKIVDFGVAKISDFEFDLDTPEASRSKLTRTGMIFGTPEYMSPEQATGLPPDHRVDIYALGVTLYELITGRVPFEGESFMSVLSKHANRQVPALRDVNPRVKVSPQLEHAVLQALRKDRNQRFQQMREMAQALQQAPELPAFPFRLSSPGTLAAAPRLSGPPIALPRAKVPPAAGRVSGPPAAILQPAPEPAGPSMPPAAPPLLTPVAASAAPATRAARKEHARRELSIVLGAIAASAALALYAAAERGGASTTRDTTEATSASDVKQAHEARPSAETAGPRTAVEEEAGDGLELVKVNVTTEPSGARVRLAGGAEVCAATPCSFDAVRGAPLSLQARRGSSLAVATLHPKTTTQLHLVLETKGPKPSPLGGLAHDDLKVPRMFRDPQ